MTKKEFVALFAEKSNFETKVAAERALDLFLETIEETLVKGEDVNFIGWGAFSVIERAAKKGRNPKTGEEIQIPAKKALKFKPGKKLADMVKN